MWRRSLRRRAMVLAVEEDGVRFHGRKPPQFSFSMLVDGTRVE